MSAPLTVYTLVPPRHSASFYYRLQVPLGTAADLGLPVKGVIDNNTADISPGDRIRAFCESDLVLLYQPVGHQPISNIRGIQSFLPSKRDGEWKWAPTVICESDDNIFNVSPLNQAFKSLGIRDLNGDLIPLGHHVGINANGEKKIIWKDGEDGFSFAKNRERIDSWRTIINMSDAVTCSTQGVADAINKEATPRRIKVFPNLVRFDHYEQVDLKEDPNKVKILWQGGIAHYEDWYPLRESLGRISRKYPEVHWIIWGAQFPWVKELIPSHQYTYKDWCAYQEYKLRLAMIGHDISLAPLQDHIFNTCRSAIKFYESSVLKNPAATLAQNSAAYKQEIKEGETGLLFNGPEEFEEKLGLLIEDAKYRKTLAANAKDWLSENRDAMKEVPKIVEYWEQIRADRMLEQPRVSDDHWAEIEAEARAEEDAELQQEAIQAV